MPDHPHDETDWGRLAAYLSGACTPEEAAETERWIRGDPARQAFVERLRAAQTRAVDGIIIDTEAEWSRMDARLRAHADDDITGPRVDAESRVPLRVVRQSEPTAAAPRILSLRHRSASSARRPWRRIAGLAAAAIVVATASIIAVQQRNHRVAQTASAHAIPMRAYTTTAGQRAEIDLADGTHVVLAPGSWLRVPVDMTVGPRAVALVGEAFFTVAHDSMRPFTVRTAESVVRDVGTAFVVTAYPETRGTQVAVTDGVVALHRAPRDPLGAVPRTDSSRATSSGPTSVVLSGTESAGQPLLLLARGDVARLDTTGTVTFRRSVDVTPYVAWTRGSLVFTGTPLREVVPMLSRWYDLDVRLGDSSTIADRHLAATFDDEPASAATRLIALALDLRVEHRGRMVTFYPLHPNAAGSPNTRRAARKPRATSF